MPIKIATIVKSNSHVDYVGRVVDRLDASAPPEASDYGFAQFVFMPVDDAKIVGVIYNTQLANPDYGNLGPRLSPPADLSVLSPDYLNEQGVLVGLLLLGWQEGEGRTTHHTVPRRVVPVGTSVYNLSDGEAHEFHKSAEGRLQLHYFSQVVAHAGPFGAPLLEAIIEQLERACDEGERQRLCVLKRSLAWQRTLGQMRL